MRIVVGRSCIILLQLIFDGGFILMLTMKNLTDARKN